MAKLTEITGLITKLAAKFKGKTKNSFDLSKQKGLDQAGKKRFVNSSKRDLHSMINAQSEVLNTLFKDFSDLGIKTPTQLNNVFKKVMARGENLDKIDLGDVDKAGTSIKEIANTTFAENENIVKILADILEKLAPKKEVAGLRGHVSGRSYLVSLSQDIGTIANLNRIAG